MGYMNIFKPLSTFLSAAPLIKSDKISGMLGLGIKLGEARSRSEYANHCALLLPILEFSLFEIFMFGQKSRRRLDAIKEMIKM